VDRHKGTFIAILHTWEKIITFYSSNRFSFIAFPFVFNTGISVID